MCILEAKLCNTDINEKIPEFGYKIFSVKPDGTLASPVMSDKWGIGEWTKDFYSLDKQETEGMDYCLRIGVGFHVFATIEDATPMFEFMINDRWSEEKYVLMKVAIKDVFAKGINSYGDAIATPVYLCRELKILEEVKIGQ